MYWITKKTYRAGVFFLDMLASFERSVLQNKRNLSYSLGFCDFGFF